MRWGIRPPERGLLKLILPLLAWAAVLSGQNAPTIKPEDKCSIEGTVVSATTGEPIKKAHLTLRPMGQPTAIPYGTISDGAGHFLLNDLDPGRYVLGATRNGFVQAAYSAHGKSRQNTPLILANGQNMKDLVFKLTPQGVITGHVVDQDGDPLARAQIQTMTYSYQGGKRQLTPGAAGTTDDLGEFRLFDIRPGKYVISASYRSQHMAGGIAERAVGSAQAIEAVEEGYPTVYYPNSPRPEGEAQIEVAPGAQIRGVDITLVRVRTYRIKGHVNANADAVRRRNIMFTLIPRTNRTPMFTSENTPRVMDAKGNFELLGVAPGSYYLFGDYMEENQRFVARTPVDVGNGNIEGVEMNFQPPAEIKGRIAVEDNGDLKNKPLHVSLEPKVDQPRMRGSGDQVKSDLTFRLQNVEPDAYDIIVYGLPDGFYVKSIRVGDQDITDTGADFSSGVPAGEMVIVVNPNGGMVEGTVQNAKAENAASATVTLIPDTAHRSNTWMYQTTNTDQNGHFTINGIRPGEYKIYAWEDLDLGAQMDPDFMKAYESAGESVSIKESSHETVQLKLISRTD